MKPAAPDRTLSAREREVLDAIVNHYIQTGVPVGSRFVSKGNSENLSPATIRSIMADLEERGYIMHPHTSAGRIPTDLGYRHYVDGLDGPRRLSRAERQAISDHLYATGGLQSLLARCCKLLSAASQHVAVGTGPDLGVAHFRHLELVKLNEQRLLVLFIDASGLVQQHVVHAHVPETQAELERYARYLNHELQGRTLAQVRDHVAGLMRAERAAYDVLARRALELGGRFFASEAVGPGELCVDGTERLLERGDFSDLDRMKALLKALDEKSRIVRLLESCIGGGGVTTAIGSENREPDLAGCSLVAAGYGYDDTRVGTLGIIGPTRMDYDRAMALVEYVAQLLGSALAGSRT